MKVKLGLKILVALLVLANIAKAQTYMEDMIGLGMPPELAEYIATNIVGGAVLGNNTYFKARNQANSANIDVLKVDANDETYINSDAGDSIHLQQGSDANRLLNFGASSDTALTLTFGDGGTTAVQQLTISASTSDADDDSSLILAGGGANGGTRGASITLPGEEVSGGSDITYNAGTGDTHIFSIAGTAEATISDDALTFSGASPTIAFGATSGIFSVGGTTELTLTDDKLTFAGATTSTIASGATLVVNPIADANRKINIGASSDTTHYITFGDAGTTAAQTMQITASTSGSDDDSQLAISGAGAIDNARGASLTLKGENFASSGGDATLGASGNIYLNGAAADSVITLYTNNTGRWSVEADGDLAGNGTTGGSLVFGTAGTGITEKVGTLAATGNNQGTAAALVSRVTTVTGADATVGVILPASPVAGDWYTIINTANATLPVYPGSGDAISGLGANNAMTLAAYTIGRCIATSNAQWWCAEPAVPG